MECTRHEKVCYDIWSLVEDPLSRVSCKVDPPLTKLVFLAHASWLIGLKPGELRPSQHHKLDHVFLKPVWQGAISS